MIHTPNADLIGINTRLDTALKELPVAVAVTNSDRRESKKVRAPVKLLLPLVRNLG